MMGSTTRVLFNGEYLDKDMSYVGGFEKIRENQLNQYQMKHNKKQMNSMTL